MSTTESDVTKNAQPAVAPHPDPATSTSDPNAASRRARLKAMEKALNEESAQEGAQRTVDKIDGKSADAADTEAEVPEPKPKKADAGWQKIEDAARKEAGFADVGETESAKEPEAAEAAEEDDTSAAAAPTEPVKDEAREKLDKLEKERKEKFEKTLKLQAKLRERDERIRAVEERLSRKEQELVDREQRVQNSLSRGEKRVELADKVLQLATENPLELLERAGVPPERVAQWIREAGDPVKQETRGIQKEIADLKGQLQKERRDQEAQRRNIQQQRENERIETEFLSYFDSDKDAFEPARIAYTKRERVTLANEIAEKATKRGLRFTLRDIAEAVNETAKDAENYKEYAALKAKKPAEEATTAAAAAPVAKPAAAPKPQAVAVTNAATQQRGEAPKRQPRDWKEARRMRLERRFAELDAGSKE